jgi:hypothetical protein
VYASANPATLEDASGLMPPGFGNLVSPDDSKTGVAFGRNQYGGWTVYGKNTLYQTDQNGRPVSRWNSGEPQTNFDMTSVAPRFANASLVQTTDVLAGLDEVMGRSSSDWVRTGSVEVASGTVAIYETGVGTTIAMSDGSSAKLVYLSLHPSDSASFTRSLGAALGRAGAAIDAYSVLTGVDEGVENYLESGGSLSLISSVWASAGPNFLGAAGSAIGASGGVALCVSFGAGALVAGACGATGSVVGNYVGQIVAPMLTDSQSGCFVLDPICNGTHLVDGLRRAR